MTMQDDLITLAQIKRNIEALNKTKAEVEERLVKTMVSKSQQTLTAMGGDIKGTLVEATRIVIDSDKLKKALGSPMWNKVTVRTLDREKLEAFVATGQIDANVVAAASEEKVNKPYVKVSGTLPTANVDTSSPAPKRRVKPAKPRTA